MHLFTICVRKETLSPHLLAFLQMPTLKKKDDDENP